MCLLRVSRRRFHRGGITFPVSPPFADPLYQEVEGSLYVLPSNRERNSARGVPAVQIVQVSDTAYTVDVTVDLLDGPGGTATGVASYTFPYELVEGQWVFTDFQMVN